MVTDVLVGVVADLRSRYGNEFKREQAAEILRDLVGADQVDHFLKQLVQVPGVVSMGDGMYGLPLDAAFCARHREWHFAVGRVDLHEAGQLGVALRLLERERPLAVGMLALLNRLTIALDSLE